MLQKEVVALEIFLAGSCLRFVFCCESSVVEMIKIVDVRWMSMNVNG